MINEGRNEATNMGTWREHHLMHEKEKSK